MMPKFVTMTLAAGVLALGLSTAAKADGQAAVEAREACMKANGKAIGLMVKMVKGETAYDKGAIDGALAEEAKACEGWATFWPEDSKPGMVKKTRAAEAIWTDPKGFEAAGMAFIKARGDIANAADEAAFKAAFPAFGGACKGCHDKFRTAEE
jgi:cytochrome c556